MKRSNSGNLKTNNRGTSFSGVDKVLQEKPPLPKGFFEQTTRVQATQIKLGLEKIRAQGNSR